MKSDSDNAFWSPAFDELGDEFTRVAKAESHSPRQPRRRRWLIAVVGLGLVGTPAAVALTSGDDPNAPLIERNPQLCEQVDCEELKARQTPTERAPWDR